MSISRIPDEDMVLCTECVFRTRKLDRREGYYYYCKNLNIRLRGRKGCVKGDRGQVTGRQTTLELLVGKKEAEE